MEIKNITCDFIISNVKNHKKHKKILLDLIQEMPESRSQQNSKSDWNLNKETPRKYLDYFYNNIIDPIMNEQKKYFKAATWHILNSWFQQYHDGTYHKYHNHESANWSNVYFIELPKPEDATQIKVREKLFKYKVKEGDIITFPAHLLHMAPAITNKRKTVIAFNSNFSYF
jgi:hypothetical protein